MIYLLSKRVDFIFSVHKLAKFSSNPGEVHFEGLVHIFRYIIDNNTLILKYYDDMKYSPLSYLFIQASNKNENQLMEFSDYSWKYCPDTSRSTVSYIIIYQGGTIDHGTHVPRYLINQVTKVSTMQHLLKE